MVTHALVTQVPLGASGGASLQHLYGAGSGWKPIRVAKTQRDFQPRGSQSGPSTHSSLAAPPSLQLPSPKNNCRDEPGGRGISKGFPLILSEALSKAGFKVGPQP